MHPEQPTVVGPRAGTEDGPPHRPHLVRHIPGDAPLGLSLRASRLFAFAGGMNLGIPTLALVVMLIWLVSNMPDPWPMLPAARAGIVTVLFCGGFNTLIWMLVSSGKGPQLAADHHGVWVQARKWRIRSAFLPWEAVDRIFVRRNRRVFWLLVCVRTVVPPPDHHLRAGLDARTQRGLFGTTFNASPFLCGRRADDVLAELSQLSGGSVQIG
jgi:hypothetical protein